MSDMVGSALIRRYIGRRFQALRKKAGLTQEKAAAALDRSRITVARTEDGDERIRFREIDVKAMLDLYDADEQDRQLLLALTAETRNGRKKSWWHDYTETELPEWFGLYVTLEDSAETIRQYESALIPGLLQTRAYAEHVMRTPTGHVTDQEAERRVQVRLDRQSVLSRPRAPRLDVILNEAVIRRPIGGAATMADQLTYLMKVREYPNINIRIVPFDIGIHAGDVANAFSLLSFPSGVAGEEPIEPTLAYVDTLTGSLYLNKPDEVAAYNLVWNDLETQALDMAKSGALIEATLKGLRND